jgi:hypothetical protein
VSLDGGYPRWKATPRQPSGTALGQQVVKSPPRTLRPAPLLDSPPAPVHCVSEMTIDEWMRAERFSNEKVAQMLRDAGVPCVATTIGRARRGSHKLSIDKAAGLWELSKNKIDPISLGIPKGLLSRSGERGPS